MSDGSEFQVCGAATENARRANSVRVLAADSSGASEDRRGRTGAADWCKLSIQALRIARTFPVTVCKTWFESMRHFR